MDEIRKDPTDQPGREKQPYTQPQLVKHGKVEDQTQQAAPPSTSRPPLPDPI